MASGRAVWGLALAAVACAPPPGGKAQSDAARATAAEPMPPDAKPAETRRVETLSSGARRIHIADPARYWRDGGFISLAPPVRIAISAEGRPLVEVQFRLPKGGAVTAAELPSQGRPTIQFPPGTEADRVSMSRYRGGVSVADVRGSRIDDEGREWFHVYRPVSGEPGAALIGYEWLREDAEQRSQATRLLVEHVARTPRPVSRSRPSLDYVSFFSRMNNCESCHYGDKAAGTDPDDRLPLWPTDRIGWYVPMAVMLPELALSTTRQWHDPNAGDALVETRCASGQARERNHAFGTWFSCDDDSVPRGVRDMGRGLAEGDDYTREVCRSRAYIYRHMDARARAVFAPVMTGCETRRHENAFAAPKR